MDKKNSKAGWIVLAVIVGVMLICAAVYAVSSVSSAVGTYLSADRSTSQGLPDGQEDGRGGDLSYDDLDDYYGQPYFGNTYTLDDLEEYFDMRLMEKSATYGGNQFGEGMYEVGDAGITTGEYRFEGNQSDLSYFYIFDKVAQESTGDTYRINVVVQYFGNYFADLQDGQIIVFKPDEDGLRMMLDDGMPIQTNEPLLSACYRVGIDIPAGEYVISVEEETEEAVAESDSEPTAYVMEDLNFEEGSIVGEYPVLKGTSRKITVEDGQYLELYGCIAELA